MASLAFKNAQVEWINYNTQQSVSTSIEWTVFVEGSTPRELALFGWPPPGHPVWNEGLIMQTQDRYPALDLGPWRRALLSTIEIQGQAAPVRREDRGGASEAPSRPDSRWR